MRQANFTILLLACLVASHAHSQAPTALPNRAADRPQAILEPGWLRRVGTQQGTLTNQPCRVCFIGDSLTELWEHTGKADWDLHFAPLKAANLGLTADRTEHILERIRRLEFRRAKPDLVVLMMGTNNLGMDPPDKPEEVFRGIQKGVAMIQTKMPQAKTLLLTIPPSGTEPKSALRQRIQETNKLLTGANWPDDVRVLPVYEAMVDEADRWRADCTLDGTHFSASGYARLAALLSPAVNEMLGATAAAAPAR
ncbi:GDSL-type esterase/lipase family protein [Roseimicrobium gellanilyticum]|nr:GDSL-type esterase/lipase family protein [Roseimicrobium gellanilyticum]